MKQVSFLKTIILILLFILFGCTGDISGTYVVDRWPLEDVLFNLGETGYEVYKNNGGYSFTLIGVKDGRLLGKKETYRSTKKDGYFYFKILEGRKIKIGGDTFTYSSVFVRLKPDQTGLEGIVEGGPLDRVSSTNSAPIHLKKIRIY